MYSVYRLIYTVAWLNGMKSMCGVDAVDRVDGVDRVARQWAGRGGCWGGLLETAF